MSVLLLQLGDIHIQRADDPILSRAVQIADATAAQAPSDLEAIWIIITGDVTQDGRESSFGMAAGFLSRVSERLNHRLACPVEFVPIPGNHDLLLGDDEEVRDQLISNLTTNAVPARSILDMLVGPLENYFNFARGLAPEERVMTEDSPFFRTVRMTLNGGTIDLHLFNSAWMSKRHERANSLFFPLDEFAAPAAKPADFAVSMIHHPFNWFRQPECMRPLRNKIEQMSDMVITGHEHANTAIDARQIGSPSIVQYVEGGVLHERTDPSMSTFTLIAIDLLNRQQRTIRHKLDPDGTYLPLSGDEPRPLVENLGRRDRGFQVSPTFREFLEDADLPLADSRQRPIRLPDIFTYPDIREDVGTLERKWKRYKGDDAVEEIMRRERVLISALPKGGRTSFAKSLFVDLLNRGRVPIYIDGRLVPDVVSDLVVRQLMAKAVKAQYVDTSLEKSTKSESRGPC